MNANEAWDITNEVREEKTELGAILVQILEKAKKGDSRIKYLVYCRNRAKSITKKLRELGYKVRADCSCSSAYLHIRWDKTNER